MKPTYAEKLLYIGNGRACWQCPRCGVGNYEIEPICILCRMTPEQAAASLEPAPEPDPEPQQRELFA